jgi:hypothetical protein
VRQAKVRTTARAPVSRFTPGARRRVLLAGVPRAEVGEAAWLVALQLWFLPVYLLLAALTPALLAAHRRRGLPQENS